MGAEEQRFKVYEGSNLVVGKNEPFHKVIINYQKQAAKGMKPGQTN